MARITGGVVNRLVMMYTTLPSGLECIWKGLKSPELASGAILTCRSAVKKSRAACDE
jgi:hypothetical protein